MPHVVRALLRREEGEGEGDQIAHLIEAAGPGRAEEGFQFREGHFDGVEVGTVRREKPHERAGGLDGGAPVRVLMDGEVVQDDDIAGPQRRDEHLVDVGAKGQRVHRAIEHGGRLQALQAQGGDHRVRLPVPERRVIMEPRAAETAPVPPEQIGRHTTFIEKPILAHVPQRLRPSPPAARFGDIRPALFSGVYGFF
jgi:hypothetical protein